jgi:CheY-like chemotaxis protein/AraC-like DNA-binding protein
MIPVMIVEDEFLVRVGLRSMIRWEEHGFTVVADAPSGEKGLAVFQEKRPYLILTDIRMSPMDGLEMMRRIREIDPDAKFIIISAYSEFEYAQQAIRYGVELYLNKSCFTSEELTPVLDRLAAQYNRPANLARSAPDASLELPGPDDPALLRRFLGETGILTAPKAVIACRGDRSADRTVEPMLLITLAREVMAKAPFFSRVFLKENFVVLLTARAEPEKIDAQLERLVSTVEGYCATPLYAGISACFTQPDYLHQALSDACKACNGFLFDKSMRLRFYQREAPDPDLDKRIRFLLDELQARISAADRQGVDELVRKAIGSATSYRSLERIMFQIIMSLEKFDHSILVSAAFKEAMSDDIQEICRALSLRAQALCGQRPNLPERDCVDEILKYVEDHLREEISLGKLAEMCHFSPNYLGQLFYQKTGIYLNAYVTNLRIHKATELLLKTDLSVCEVGQTVGIDDPHYFSKLFKNRMGVSPNKYKGIWYE